MTTSKENERRRFVRAYGNMPHRCPSCHGIPEAIYEGKGSALWFRIYRCDRGCNVRWWRGWHD